MGNSTSNRKGNYSRLQQFMGKEHSQGEADTGREHSPSDGRPCRLHLEHRPGVEKGLVLGFVWICNHRMIFCWQGWLLLKGGIPVLLTVSTAETVELHKIFSMLLPHWLPFNGKHTSWRCVPPALASLHSYSPSLCQKCTY